VLGLVNVDSPQLSGIFRIDLGVVCYLLALRQRLESRVLYNGKVDENVSGSVVI
jgi:broad-specificity NMP kinase